MVPVVRNGILTYPRYNTGVITPPLANPNAHPMSKYYKADYGQKYGARDMHHGEHTTLKEDVKALDQLTV